MASLKDLLQKPSQAPKLGRTEPQPQSARDVQTVTSDPADERSTDPNKLPGFTLTWRDIRYSVPLEAEARIVIY
jgi:hypothetical protein